MRHLSLLRHAKSSWDDHSLDDFYRPLNGRGRRAAEAIGKYFVESGASFDLILASPAQRVGETLKGMARAGWHGVVQFEQSIYDAALRDLLQMVRTAPPNVRRLLIVGHNPTIGLLASQLSQDDGTELRAVMAAKYPTGALAQIELEVDDWKEVVPQCGRLTAFVTPRSLGVT